MVAIALAKVPNRRQSGRATLVVACTTSVLSHCAEAVGVVHKEAELVFFLVLANLSELPLVASHSEDPFRHDEDAPAGLIGQVLGTLELLFKASMSLCWNTKRFLGEGERHRPCTREIRCRTQ